MSNENEAPILGVMVDESGSVSGVVTNANAFIGVPVVVIEQGTDGFEFEDLTTIRPHNQPSFEALTNRVGGVYEADFGMDDL